MPFTPPNIGQINDISDSGVQLSSTENFQTGETIELKIQRADGSFLPVQGEVCYKKSNSTSNSYGIRFLKTIPIILALYAPLNMITAASVQASWGGTEINNVQLDDSGVSVYNKSWSFEQDGRTRTYELHVPPSYNPDEPMPLVMLFHGNTETGKGIQDYAGLDELSDNLEQGFIVVYPDAVKRKWSIGEDSDVQGVDDVEFVLELQYQLEQVLNIDSSRIYASGMSRGGLFAMKLGCELSESIAAVSAVAATMRDDSYHTDCNPTAAVPTAIIFGQDDPIMPFFGGEVKLKNKFLGNAVSIQQTVDFWADNNECTSFTTTRLENKKKWDGTEVSKIEYSNCHNDKNVVHYDIAGGGHTWPGTFTTMKKIIGNASRDINAADVMWDFFSTKSTNI